MLSILRRTALAARPVASSQHVVAGPSSVGTRTLTAAAALAKNPQYPPRPKVAEADIEEKFLKGSGPGGQKINKTSSAVQLLHVPSGTVVKCQATRSRDQNRKIARQLLADRLEVAEKGEDSRVRVKQMVKSRKKASAMKKSKRKYRALEVEKKRSEAAGVEGEQGVDDDGVPAAAAAAEDKGVQERTCHEGPDAAQKQGRGDGLPQM